MMMNSYSESATLSLLAFGRCLSNRSAVLVVLLARRNPIFLGHSRVGLHFEQIFLLIGWVSAQRVAESRVLVCNASTELVLVDTVK